MFGRALTTHLSRLHPSNIRSEIPSNDGIVGWPVGTLVYYRMYSVQKGRGEKWLAGVIKGHVATRILVIQCHDGSEVRRHLNQVRRRLSLSDSEAPSCLQNASTLAAAALEAAEAARGQLAECRGRAPDPGQQLPAPPEAIIVATQQEQEPLLQPEPPQLRRSDRLQNATSSASVDDPTLDSNVAATASGSARSSHRGRGLGSFTCGRGGMSRRPGKQ